VHGSIRQPCAASYLISGPLGSSWRQGSPVYVCLREVSRGSPYQALQPAQASVPRASAPPAAQIIEQHCEARPAPAAQCRLTSYAHKQALPQAGGWQLVYQQMSAIAETPSRVQGGRCSRVCCPAGHHCLQVVRVIDMEMGLAPATRPGSACLRAWARCSSEQHAFLLVPSMEWSSAVTCMV